MESTEQNISKHISFLHTTMKLDQFYQDTVQQVSLTLLQHEVVYIHFKNTAQWLFDFKQFDCFGCHRLSAHILVIDYIWKTPGNSIYFQINICW